MQQDLRKCAEICCVENVEHTHTGFAALTSESELDLLPKSLPAIFSGVQVHTVNIKHTNTISTTHNIKHKNTISTTHKKSTTHKTKKHNIYDTNI